MREHRDPAGQLCAVTITRTEWRSRRHLLDRGRSYVYPTARAATPVRAIVVPDGSREARPNRKRGGR